MPAGVHSASRCIPKGRDKTFISDEFGIILWSNYTKSKGKNFEEKDLGVTKMCIVQNVVQFGRWFNCFKHLDLHLQYMPQKIKGSVQSHVKII